MPTVAVEPELYKRVEEAAAEHQASIDTLLNNAVRRYLWDLDRMKISEESKRYFQQHAKLKVMYLGQYIAMRNGEVVDHDADFDKLRGRVRQKFGHAPIMMTLVEEAAEKVLTRHGFRLESGNQ